jgi:hypothetical protein
MLFARLNLQIASLLLAKGAALWLIDELCATLHFLRPQIIQSFGTAFDEYM